MKTISRQHAYYLRNRERIANKRNLEKLSPIEKWYERVFLKELRKLIRSGAVSYNGDKFYVGG